MYEDAAALAGQVHAATHVDERGQSAGGRAKLPGAMLAEIAAKAGVSEFAVCRLLTSPSALSAMEYVRRLLLPE
jgi:hypothetical protein